jgi:hypothetical protein
LFDELTLELPSLHPNQLRVIEEKARYNVVDCGRRFGKSFLGIDLVIDTALSAGRAGWFAPEYKLLSEAWRDIKALCADVIKSANDQERRVELITGGVIEAWSFDRNPNAGRSRKYHRVVIDEAAHATNLETVWTKAVRPTLTDYKGDAWFLSSPNGEDYFYRLWRRGQEGEPGWRSWVFTSYDNPFLDPTEIDAARLDLPDWVFEQEYLAKFHAETQDVLIPAPWLDRAGEAGIIATVERLRGQGKGGRRRLAMDLGYGTGADRTVAVAADDLGFLEIRASNRAGVPEAALLMVEMCDRWGVSSERATYDANGPGRDMPRYLEAHKFNAQPYHGSGKGGPKHVNKRTRSAWRLRQRLDPERPVIPMQDRDDGNVWKAPPELRKAEPQPPFAIPNMPAKMREELTGLRYEMRDAKLALETKEDFMKRLGRSPDYADAAIMLFSFGDES